MWKEYMCFYDRETKTVKIYHNHNYSDDIDLIVTLYSSRGGKHLEDKIKNYLMKKGFTFGNEEYIILEGKSGIITKEEWQQFYTLKKKRKEQNQ